LAPRAARLWRHRDFLRLWGGQTVSQVGSQITLLALPLTAVLTLNATPGQMGRLFALQNAAYLLVGLPAGVWVDRLPRRPLLIASDGARAVLLGSIPVAALSGRLQIAQLYVVGFLVGIGTLVFDVAYQAYLPTLIQRAQLLEGNGKLEASAAVARIAGPGLAGSLVQLITAPLTLLADALSFVVSVLSILTIRTREDRSPIAQDQPLVGAIRAGLRLLCGHPLLRPLALSHALTNLGGSIIEAVVVLYVTRTLRVGSGLLGLIVASGSVGALLGALLAARASARFGLGRIFMGKVILVSAGSLLIPAVSGTAAVTVPVLIAAWLLSGCGESLYRVNNLSLRQSIVPDQLQGRVNASILFITRGVIPIGNLIGGALGGRVGLRATLLVGAVVIGAALVAIVCSPLRALRAPPMAASGAAAAP
jgi:MFS family permease